ncbi:acyltransferase [Parabacteroides bouchesdurhonensis]|uniref:acyltransferase n=1 Tax=Parabacteroides bouchesdurhonensis TaxID=1936995 RepID=UPI000C8277D3|nr:galactoside O-acetyltransferase [Parabacteroides bouchesdurhonensis]
MKNSFYTQDEVLEIGFKSIGKNVCISKKTSFYNPENIEIGNNVRIDDFCILSGNIKIGSYVHISASTILYGKKGIVLSDFTGISARSIIYSEVDDFSGNYMIGPMCSAEYTNVTGGTVYLEKYVQIGASCVIMPNLRLKEGSAVGAMSFVNRDLESWTIYAGIPVKRIKGRSERLKNYCLDVE